MGRESGAAAARLAHREGEFTLRTDSCRSNAATDATPRARSGRRRTDRPRSRRRSPRELQPECPTAPRQRRPQTTTTAERSGAMQAQAPPWSGPSWPTQLERKLDRLILLFVIGLVVAVLLMLTRAAYAARRIATQETMATALFHIDAVVAIEAVAREIRYDAGAQGRPSGQDPRGGLCNHRCGKSGLRDDRSDPRGGLHDLRESG